MFTSDVVCLLDVDQVSSCVKSDKKYIPFFMHDFHKYGWPVHWHKINIYNIYI